MIIEERYNIWFRKKRENLEKTKGLESKQLLARIQSLEETQNPFQLRRNIGLLYDIVKEYAQEKRNLKWLEQLVQEIKEWNAIMESEVSLSSYSLGDVLDGLFAETLDVDQAIDLLENGNE